jgi:hypothetical protein
MTEPRSGLHQAKLRQEDAYPGLASTNGGTRAVAGRTAYREEFHRDYGPDADERLDSTESGREF